MFLNTKKPPKNHDNTETLQFERLFSHYIFVSIYDVSTWTSRQKISWIAVVSEDPEINSAYQQANFLELFACFLKKNTHISMISPTKNVVIQFISILDSIMVYNFNLPHCNFCLTVDMLHPSPSCLENGGCTILLRHIFLNSDTGRSSLLKSN